MTTDRAVVAAEPLVRWSWVGDHLDEIWRLLVQHLELTFIAVGVGFAIAFVLALVALRWRPVYAPVNGITGIMYAIPSLALFVLLVPITGLTTLTAEIALVSYTLQILFRSIVAGVEGVPDSVRESAAGMGYTRRRQLWTIELPLAVPVIMGGLRVATVTTVGLVPIAGYLGSDQGGLGQLIFDGLDRFFNTPLLVGAVLTVALAVALDLTIVVAQRALTPWTRLRGAVAVTFLHDVFVWFNDPLNWQGPNGIAHRLVEHVALAVGSLLIVCVLAVPAGLLLGRSRRKGSIAVNVANVGRAIPSFAILALGVIWIGIGYRPALVALVLLALPPIFVFTFTAVREVDPSTVEAARGMGMTEGRLLRRVQLPIATPLMLDGIRLSSAAVIATATLAAVVGWGGLGRYIVDGFAVRDFVEVFAGVVLVAGLVLVSEVVFALLLRFAVSPGIRRRGRTRRRPWHGRTSAHHSQSRPNGSELRLGADSVS